MAVTVPGQEDVVIRIGVKVQNLKQKMARVREQIKSLSRTKANKGTALAAQFFPARQEIKKNLTNMKEQMNKINSDNKILNGGKKFSPETQARYDMLMKKTGEARVGLARLNTAEKQAAQTIRDKYNPQIDSQRTKLSKQSKQLRLLNGRMAKSKAVLQDMTKASKRADVPFQGWALSIMFLGQMMVRVMSQVYTASSKVFREVVESSGEAKNGFAELEGSLKFLAFTSGQALEPLSEDIKNVTDDTRGWIEENPKLYAGLVKNFAITGGFLAILGTATLGIAGIIGAFKKWKHWIGLIVKAWPLLMAKLAAFKTALFTLKGLMATSIVLAIILALFWLYRLGTALGGFKEFWISVWRGIERVNNTVWSAVTASAMWAFNKIKEGLNLLGGDFDTSTNTWGDYFYDFFDKVDKEMNERLPSAVEQIQPASFGEFLSTLGGEFGNNVDSSTTSGDTYNIENNFTGTGSDEALDEFDRIMQEFEARE